MSGPTSGGSARKVGVVGDIHAEDIALEVALAMFARSQVDRVLAVGDIVDGLGRVDRCCELLKAADACVVRGNHERWLLNAEMRELPEATPPSALSHTTRRFLESLPAVLEFDTPGGKLLLCHGLGEDDMAALKPHDTGYALETNDALQKLLRAGRYAYVVAGHTHERMVRRIASLTLINAGTLYRHDNPCFCIIDFEEERAQFYEIEGATTREAETRRLADWTELF
jgi:putative phosphoesterase